MIFVFAALHIYHAAMRLGGMQLEDIELRYRTSRCGRGLLFSHPIAREVGYSRFPVLLELSDWNLNYRHYDRPLFKSSDIYIKCGSSGNVHYYGTAWDNLS